MSMSVLDIRPTREYWNMKKRIAKSNPTTRAKKVEEMPRMIRTMIWSGDLEIEVSETVKRVAIKRGRDRFVFCLPVPTKLKGKR